ncbi:AraC-like DNA-binding protein [Silvimonas terrae]|uniref:AraC-like DNA-binding protein n=1 Tax=Silvimonas terrae TaxID=300266 RepID=A0A840RG09_9NEIS|nr:helix-turn-helix transcriptional regulator [Silvimonas terrae]MBB5191243.1 AraC-like DNA-binding protein [Silvimonas terrae]
MLQPDNALRVRMDHYADGHIESWHSHRQGQWLYAQSGMVRVYIDNAIWTLPPLRALWLPPTKGHEVRAIGTVNMASVYLEPEQVPSHLARHGVFNVSAMVDVLLNNLLIEQNEPASVRRQMMADLLLHEVCAAPHAPDLALPMPQERRLRRLCEALMLDPANSDGLELWGDRVGASARTIVRLFRDETGLSFGQWRDQMRVSDALIRLARKEPVHSIARQLGYHSSSAFIAMFRKVSGFSPSQAIR